MNKLKTALNLFLIIGLTSCSSQKEIKKIPFQTQEVYFQKWIGGQELTGSGTIFYIQFKTSFSPNFLLKKVYFQGKEANFEKRDSITFVAQFYQKPKNKKDYLRDSKSETINPKFNLKPNDAIVEFIHDNKMAHFKIENIKEKELLAYPSTKPRN